MEKNHSSIVGFITVFMIWEARNATRVLENIFEIDLAISKHGATFANTSKPQYASFLAFPISPIYRGFERNVQISLYLLNSFSS